CGAAFPDTRRRRPERSWSRTSAATRIDPHAGIAGSDAWLRRAALLHASQRFWLFQDAGGNGTRLGRPSPRGHGPRDSRLPPKRRDQWLGRCARRTRSSSSRGIAHPEGRATRRRCFLQAARFFPGRPGLGALGRPKARRCAGPRQRRAFGRPKRSEEHTSELQSRSDLVCRLLLEKKNIKIKITM